jgi:tetratricopeptide (TPR) repeat protein
VVWLAAGTIALVEGGLLSLLGDFTREPGHCLDGARTEHAGAAAVQALADLANGEVLRQRYRSAQELLHRALSQHPPCALRARILRSLGVTAARLGQDEEAVRYYTRYVLLDPEKLALPGCRLHTHADGGCATGCN